MARQGWAEGHLVVVEGSDAGPPGGYPPIHSNQPPGGPHAEPWVSFLSLPVVQDRKTPLGARGSSGWFDWGAESSAVQGKMR